MLRGKQLNLRPFTQDDLTLFQELANDPLYNSEFNNFGLRNSVHFQKMQKHC